MEWGIIYYRLYGMTRIDHITQNIQNPHLIKQILDHMNFLCQCSIPVWTRFIEKGMVNMGRPILTT